MLKWAGWHDELDQLFFQTNLNFAIFPVGNGGFQGGIHPKMIRLQKEQEAHHQMPTRVLNKP